MDSGLQQLLCPEGMATVADVGTALGVEAQLPPTSAWEEGSLSSERVAQPLALSICIQLHKANVSNRLVGGCLSHGLDMTPAQWAQSQNGYRNTG